MAAGPPTLCILPDWTLLRHPRHRFAGGRDRLGKSDGVARRSMSVAEAAFAVGRIGLAQFVPLFALTLVAGEAADRYDRRRILALCYLAQFLTAVGLAARSSLGGGLWPIFALAALFGCSRAFFQPTASALGPMLVPLRLLPRAIATNSLAAQLASILGPALGGLLCVVSPVLGYAVSAGLYAGAAACAMMIRSDTQPILGADRSRVAQIRERDLVYVWGNKLVLGCDLSRPVRGTPGRSDRIAPCICQRRAQSRTAGVRHSTSITRRRGPHCGRISGVSANPRPRRRENVPGGRPVRIDDRRVRLFSVGSAFHARVGGARRRGHGVGVHTPKLGSRSLLQTECAAGCRQFRLCSSGRRTSWESLRAGSWLACSGRSEPWRSGGSGAMACDGPLGLAAVPAGCARRIGLPEVTNERMTQPIRAKESPSLTSDFEVG